MLRQPDLFGSEPLTMRHETGRTQPRLWVRRLTIWENANTIVRDIELRPGLNIIWSPDPADQTVEGKSDHLGHGSGKTLFCRLLRYCLGEARYAPDEQRLRIASGFSDGWVSAEVLLDGKPWALLRPLGSARAHYAIPDALPQDLLADLPEPTGMEPMLEAIEQQILTPAATALMPVENRFDAWRVALAWLTRDQECRFNHVLDWRSPDSDSGSPTRSLSAAKHLEALRALIGAIGIQELQLRAEIAALDERHKTSVQEVARRKWESDRLRAEIATLIEVDLSALPEGKLCIEVLRKAAIQKLALSSKVDPTRDASDLDALRARYDEQRLHVVEIEKREAVSKAQIPVIESLLTRMKSELPGSFAQIRDAEKPVCTICEVSIDRVLAEGCSLSHKLPNLEALRARHEKLQKDIAAQAQNLSDAQSVADLASAELPTARAKQKELKGRVRAAERLRDARSGTWFNVRRALDDVRRLDQLLAELERVQTQLDSHAGQLDAKREQAGTFREAQRAVFDRLSRYFDGVIREMVGPAAKGMVSLDGNGLKLMVELGGERSTAAIESLKVVAFDLAAMYMSVEGGTRLPAFLLHDSPREADLGLSVYHRLFTLNKRMESTGPVLFQYIVTTTTRPPDEVQTMPWLRETLRGTPAEERLVRRDL